MFYPVMQIRCGMMTLGCKRSEGYLFRRLTLR